MAETGKLKSFLFASCSAEGLTQPGLCFYGSKDPQGGGKGTGRLQGDYRTLLLGYLAGRA